MYFEARAYLECKVKPRIYKTLVQSFIDEDSVLISEKIYRDTKCGDKHLYTFTYFQYKKQYTKICLHTLPIGGGGGGGRDKTGLGISENMNIKW